MKTTTSEAVDGYLSLSIKADATDVSAGIAYLIAKCAGENGVNPHDALDLEFAVRAKVGADYLQAYLDHNLPLFLASKAIGLEKLQTILEPRLTSTVESVQKDQAIAFTVSVLLKPQFELSSYDPVTIDIPPITVSESEIDDQMLMLAETFASMEDAGTDQSSQTNRIIPAITDIWIEQNIPGASTVPELREMLKKNAIQFKQSEQTEFIAYSAASELAKRLQGDISEDIFEFTKNDLLSALERNLEVQGRSLAEFIEAQGGEQVFTQQMLFQTDEVLRQGFALDALARHFDIQLTAADLDDAFTRMAPGHEEIARSDFQATGRMYVMEEAALRIKTNLWLVEQAEINYLSSPTE